MLLRHFSLFLLLLGLSNGWEIGFKYFDYKRCATETACFVRGSCYGGTANEFVQFKENTLHLSKAHLCDVIVQIKPFKEDNFHVLIQLRLNDNEKPIENNQILLEGDNRVIFRCGRGVVDGLEAGKNMRAQWHWTTRIANRYVLYSVRLFAYDPDNLLGKSQSLSFKTDTLHKITFPLDNQQHGMFDIANQLVMCNSDLLTSFNSENKYELQQEVDITRTKISCEKGKLKLDIHGPAYPNVITKSLECRRLDDNTNKYGWFFHHEYGWAKITEETPVVCAIPFCSLCAPYKFDTSCTGCTAPTVVHADTELDRWDYKPRSCMFLECPGQKWSMDGKVVDGVKMKCDRNSVTRENVWEFETSEKSFTPAPKMGCSDKFDCFKFSKLTLDPSVIVNSNKIKCDDQSVLISSIGLSENEYTCDTSTGFYVSGTGSSIPKGESLACQKMCSLCLLTGVDSSCSGCTAPTSKIDNNGCNYLECPNNKWRVDGAVITVEVKCDVTSNEQALKRGNWYYWDTIDVATRTSHTRAVKMGCSDKFDCVEFSKVTLDASVTSVGNILSCSDSEFIIKSSTGINALSLTCDESNGFYKDGTTIVPSGDNLACHKVCSLCPQYEFDNSCPGCTAPTMETEDGCTVMKCTNNKWRHDGGVVDGKVECRKDPANALSALWYFDNEVAPKMGCSEKYDCFVYSKLTLDASISVNGNTLSCSDTSSILRTSAGVYAVSFVCDESSGLFKDGATIVPKGDSLSCHKTCSLCAPYDHDIDCPGCTAPNPITKDDCLTMECPANKWRMEGGVFDGIAECERDPTDATKATWFFGNQLATKMGCSEKFECVEFSKLNLDSAIETVDKTLKCSDNLSVLRTSTWVRAPSFTCDESTGLYKDGTKTVPKGETLTCVKLCSLCPRYEYDRDCRGCTLPRPIREDECMIMECPLNKWRKEGGVVDGKVECKGDPTDATEGAWFFGDQLADEMGCSDKFDCADFSRLTMDGSVELIDNSLKCTDSSLVLRSSSGISSFSFTCDDSTGLYKNREKIVAQAESLSCVKVCSLCEAKELDSSCPGCTAPAKKTIDNCSIMECPSNKWRKDGGVVDGKVECKIDPNDAAKGAWFFSDQIATKMGCSDKFDCIEFSKLNLDTAVKIDGKNLTCSDTSSTLRTSTGLSASSFTCDESTGFYKDGTEIVPKGATLTCEKPKSDDSSAMYGAIGAIASLLVIAGIIVMALFVIRKKQAAEIKHVPVTETPKSSTLTTSKDAPSSGAPSPISPSSMVPSST